ncbi:M23 family metallopeptidase [Pedobacter sp. BS3]|uniref:M23 family metallopeptidase n=1 Tax=Pedobacter sp. BS3 TaxID=2567937 RepID=UPI0011EF0049|nr:M23 family metallopeptidase [Pedobacter sp. BS3]TZF81770.1 M23 family metallopeptidase [Pedobacter sp. BS3]
MKLFNLLLFLSITLRLTAQDVYTSRNYPHDYFTKPLDLPPSLAGSFGEIRGGHFHSGLDYRTNQREGYPVYAREDGYISRLRVQIGGGGNIVYINHPNGYTTVYMHLQRFNARISQAVKAYQYRQQRFDVDFPLMPIEIPVKKGEIIAWSGRTGAVAGPHLHFEIRDTKTEETINPQLFGLEVPDNVKPVINGLYMYRLNGLPFSQNTPKQYFQIVGANGNYHINQSPVIQAGNEVGFGIMTYDQNVPGGNKNGVYSIELQLDGQPIYLSALEGFFFQNSRAVNSHIDYPALLTMGRTIQKSFVEPGNPLTIYKIVQNRGIIRLSDDSVHNLQYIVKDARGNTSTLSFKLKYNPKAILEAKETPGVKTFLYNQDNEFSNENVRVFIPKGNLYSDISFQYSESAKPIRGYSKTEHIHTRLIPVHQGYELWIKPDSTLRPELQPKAIIMDTRGIPQGGKFDNGYVKTTTRNFGNFYVGVDTIAPVIRPLNISDGKSLAGIERISFRISDNLTGIGTFNGYIDGNWVLMEFNPSTATLWHTFEDNLKPGKHTFQLVVTDLKQNSTTYTATFYK